MHSFFVTRPGIKWKIENRPLKVTLHFHYTNGIVPWKSADPSSNLWWYWQVCTFDFIGKLSLSVIGVLQVVSQCLKISQKVSLKDQIEYVWKPKNSNNFYISKHSHIFNFLCKYINWIKLARKEKSHLKNGVMPTQKRLQNGS